jgi:hypothetical protein
MVPDNLAKAGSAIEAAANKYRWRLQRHLTGRFHPTRRKRERLKA